MSEQWSAVTSPAGAYAYERTLRWDAKDSPLPCFILLNPSTGPLDEHDEATRLLAQLVRKKWAGYPGLRIRYLFALRTDDSPFNALGDPALPLFHLDVESVGPDNDEHLARCVDDAEVFTAWGLRGRWQGRARKVIDLLRGAGVVDIGPLGAKSAHPLVMLGSYEAVNPNFEVFNKRGAR